MILPSRPAGVPAARSGDQCTLERPRKPLSKAVPKERLSSWMPYLIFGLCLIPYLFPFMRLLLLSGDEGTFLTDAVRVTQGQVPFRDFFETPGPGSFYLLALLFKVMGTSFLTARVWLAISTFCTALLLYFLARRLGSRYSSLPVIFFLATSFGALWPAVSHHHDSDLFGLLSFIALLYWTDTHRELWLMVAGTLAGITTCFTQPKGILLFISFLTLVALLHGKAKLAASFAWLGTGYLSVAIAVLALYWRAGGLTDLIYANLVWPLTQYSAVNEVPYAYGVAKFYAEPWIAGLSAVLPSFIAFAIASFLLIPLLLVAALPVIAGLAALRYRTVAFNKSTLPYWLAGTALWLSEIHRKDITHLVSGSSLLIILVFYLLGWERNRYYIQSAQLICLATFGLALFNFLFALSAHRVETRRGTVYLFQSDPVIGFLNTHVQFGEEIFAYPYSPIYYFLGGAKNPTRYSILMYGINTDSQFRDAIESLENKKVRYVIWQREFNEEAKVGWPAYSAPRKERQIMETYLSAYYEVREHLKRFDILERKAGQSWRLANH